MWFQDFVTVFNQSYNCQTNHYLGRNRLPNARLSILLFYPWFNHFSWAWSLFSWLKFFFNSTACFICFTQEFSVVRPTEISVMKCTYTNFCTPHYRKFLCKADETSLSWIYPMLLTKFTLSKFHLIVVQIPYARHLLIRSRFWIQAIHKAKGHSA